MYNSSSWYQTGRPTYGASTQCRKPFVQSTVFPYRSQLHAPGGPGILFRRCYISPLGVRLSKWKLYTIHVLGCLTLFNTVLDFSEMQKQKTTSALPDFGLKC